MATSGSNRGNTGQNSRRRVRRNPMLPNDLNASSQRLRYHAVLVEFMEYKNATTYAADKTFTSEELLTIVPQDIRKWMAFRVFGKEDPSDTDNPIHARSSSLTFWKKSISSFMPNKGVGWIVDGADPNIGRGNPTRSNEINSLIQAVRRKETRRIGKPSQADRAFIKAEYVQAVDLLSCHGHLIDRLRHVAMLNFQYHLIGRSDDTAHVRKNCFKASAQFSGYLTVKLRWSKNVMEERDCPQQIIMGSMNPRYCVLVSLSLFLEKWIKDGEGATSQWLFANGMTDESSDQVEQDKEAKKCKSAYTRAMTKGVFDNPTFTRTDTIPGKLGTHSIKKFGTTQARSGGAHRDEVDYRARWKNKRMQDRYTDTQLDWPDIRTASKLCEGGVALYKVLDGSGITDEWLITQVAPNIASVFGSTTAAILGKSLLWACFDPSTADRVSPDIKHDLIAKYIRLETGIADGVNPVEKLEVIPSEQDGAVSLDAIPNEGAIPNEDIGGGGAVAAGGGGGAVGEGRVGRAVAGGRQLGTRRAQPTGIPVDQISALARHNVHWRSALYAKCSSTSSRVMEMQNTVVSEFADLKRRLRRIEENLRSIQVAPARRGGAHGPVAYRLGTDAGDTRPAVLHGCPRTLAVLWDEYQNGIGGNKPARMFTRRERGGRVKFRYSRRKVFWDCMSRLLSRGNTIATAIAKIKGVYGDVSVTKTLERMRPDERAGGHANLRT